MNRILISLAAFAGTGQLRGQAVPDTGRCRSALSAPSADSQTKVIGVRVSPYDPSNRISKRYQELIGVGIRQILHVPQPLELTTYSTGSDEGPSKDTTIASLIVWGAYRAMLHRDGRLTNVRAVGGSRDASFDDAFIRAVSELGTSGLLPPATEPAVAFKGDSLDVRIEVSPKRRNPAEASSEADKTPLLQVRLPIRRITQQVKPKPGNLAPRYPTDLRNAGVEGKVVLEFVVDATGVPLLSTVQITTMAAPQFMSAAMAVIPRHHFEPLMVEGCAVPIWVALPFEFRLTRP